jgi:hypothetical protein
MGGVSPATCWASYKYEIKFWYTVESCWIFFVNYTMMHGSTDINTHSEGGEWSVSRTGRTLPPGKTRYPLYKKLSGPQGRSGRAENLAPTGIRSPDRPTRSSVAIPTELPGPRYLDTEHFVLTWYTYIPFICDKSVTTQNFGFLSSWYRKKRLQMHF